MRSGTHLHPLALIEQSMTAMISFPSGQGDTRRTAFSKPHEGLTMVWLRDSTIVYYEGKTSL